MKTRLNAAGEFGAQTASSVRCYEVMDTMMHSQATIRGLMIPGELKVAVLKTVTSEMKWARARAKENIARW